MLANVTSNKNQCKANAFEISCLAVHVFDKETS